MRLAAFLIAVLVSWAADAPAQTVQDLCNRATMTAAANGTVTAEAFVYGSAERYVCTYTPSTFIDGSVHPLLIALHGGSGNASQMMEDSHGIIATAEAMGAIALFPNGLPRAGCGTALCLDNNWNAPDNVFFLAELIGRQKASGRVIDERVHLVGFSGGAKLIYEVAATPGFPHAIHSVATVAGAFALFHADHPEEGFTAVQLHEGAPVSALLVQGGGDAKFPAAGGLDETGREAHASFRAKVDYWRLVTGTSAAAAQAVDVPALDPNAPADLEALSYDAGGPTVIEILDPGLEHAWPDWDVMLVAKRLFEG